MEGHSIGYVCDSQGGIFWATYVVTGMDLRLVGDIGNCTICI